MAEDNRNKPLYMISVAAELTGMHPQTLRVYESKGLVNPQRSGGNTRLYSRADIERLELINQLTDEGINLAGVVRILDMKERAEERERENEKLRARMRQLEDELHEYKMQKKITSLAPRDGSVNPEQVMRKLLGAGVDAARRPERQFVIQKARHDQKVYALPFSCQLVRSGRRSLSVLYLRRCLAPNAVVVGSHWGPLAVVAKTSVLPE